MALPKLFDLIDLDHIPNEHLCGIGRVALTWAFLDGAIERIIWELSGLSSSQSKEKYGIAFTTHMSMPQKLDVMNALMNEVYGITEYTRELKAISKHVRESLSTKRNEIVHSRVLNIREIDSVFRTVYKARGQVKREAKSVTVEEYNEIAAEILEAANKVYTILAAVIQMQKARELAQTQNNK